MPPSIDLRVSVEPGVDADAEHLARLAESLRVELLELDVDDVAPAPAGPAPPGARSVEALAVGALVVRFARSPEALTALARTVRGWLSVHGGRHVKMELDGDVLELTGVSAADQERLVTAWIERHGGG